MPRLGEEDIAEIVPQIADADEQPQNGNENENNNNINVENNHPVIQNANNNNAENANVNNNNENNDNGHQPDIQQPVVNNNNNNVPPANENNIIHPVNNNNNNNNNHNNDNNGGGNHQPAPVNREEAIKRVMANKLRNRHTDLDPAPKKESKTTLAEKLDSASDMAGIVGALGGAGNSIAELVHREQKGMSSKDTDSFTDTTAKVSTQMDAINALSSGLGAVSNTISLFSNAKKAKKANNKSKKNRSAARFAAAGNFFSALGNYGKVGGAGLKTFGDVKGKHKDASNFLGLASGGAAFIGAGLGVAGNLRQQTYKRRIRNSSRNVGNEIGHMINADPKKMKRNMKAMLMAEEMNRSNWKDYTKGIGGLLASGIGLANSAMKTFGFGFADNPIWKGISAASGLLKYAGKYFDKHNKKTAHKTDKEKYMKEEKWSAPKLNAIKVQFRVAKNQLQERDPNFRMANYGNEEISDNEIMRLYMYRLGMDTHINDEAPTKDEINQAFDRLARKRAKHIMSEEGELKRKMLSALQLDDDASEDDVFKVLCGN